MRAETRAEFPRLRGSVYRALVIGTRMHVLVTRRILGGVKRNAERASSGRGLCDSCRHQRLVPNTRGSVFSLCERSRRIRPTRATRRSRCSAAAGFEPDPRSAGSAAPPR